MTAMATKWPFKSSSQFLKIPWTMVNMSAKFHAWTLNFDFFQISETRYHFWRQTFLNGRHCHHVTFFQVALNFKIFPEPWSICLQNFNRWRQNPHFFHIRPYLIQNIIFSGHFFKWPPWPPCDFFKWISVLKYSLSQGRHVCKISCLNVKTHIFFQISYKISLLATI